MGSSACLPRIHKLPHDQKLEWHSRWTRVGPLRDLGGRGGRPAARRFALVLNWFAALGWRLWCRAWDDASVDWTSVRKRRTTIFRKFSILYLGREGKKTRNGCTRHHRKFSVRLIMEKAPNWVACGPKIAELRSPHWAGNLELFVWSLKKSSLQEISEAWIVCRELYVDRRAVSWDNPNWPRKGQILIVNGIRARLRWEGR